SIKVEGSVYGGGSIDYEYDNSTARNTVIWIRGLRGGVTVTIAQKSGKYTGAVDYTENFIGTNWIRLDGNFMGWSGPNPEEPPEQSFNYLFKDYPIYNFIRDGLVIYDTFSV
ncbi:MAG: hypothetical protein FWE62_04490, partial [Firmicutes bacterium]|nr:hypothetical protein [Bacillota bacterium]